LFAYNIVQFALINRERIDILSLFGEEQGVKHVLASISLYMILIASLYKVAPINMIIITTIV
jgi:hypothetical protein